MKTKKIYQCDICGTEYEDEAVCRGCEKCHLSTKKFDMCGYNPLQSYPDWISVEIEDGVILGYKYSNEITERIKHEKANETKAYYENNEIEDKKLFVSNLGWLLSQTRNQVKACEYYQFEDGDEIVNIFFTNGYTKTVNVSADSYVAIVKDVAKELG